MSTTPNWASEVKFAITVCDTNGKLLHMNRKSKDTFFPDKYEISDDINIMDCHPPMAQAKITDLLSTHETNAYTIEKKGIKKLIYQTPWFENGEFQGLVELSLPLPENLPHFKRD